MPDKKILNPSSSGMDIPDAAIERIARVMLPMIQKYYESEKPSSSLRRRNTKSLSSETRKGRIVSASEAGIWSIICPIPNC